MLPELQQYVHCSGYNHEEEEEEEEEEESSHDIRVSSCIM